MLDLSIDLSLELSIPSLQDDQVTDSIVLVDSTAEDTEDSIVAQIAAQMLKDEAKEEQDKHIPPENKKFIGELLSQIRDEKVNLYHHLLAWQAEASEYALSYEAPVAQGGDTQDPTAYEDYDFNDGVVADGDTEGLAHSAVGFVSAYDGWSAENHRKLGEIRATIRDCWSAIRLLQKDTEGQERHMAYGIGGTNRLVWAFDPWIQRTNPDTGLVEHNPTWGSWIDKGTPGLKVIWPLPMAEGTAPEPLSDNFQQEIEYQADWYEVKAEGNRQRIDAFFEKANKDNYDQKLVTWAEADRAAWLDNQRFIRVTSRARLDALNDPEAFADAVEEARLDAYPETYDTTDRGSFEPGPYHEAEGYPVDRELDPWDTQVVGKAQVVADGTIVRQLLYTISAEGHKRTVITEYAFQNQHANNIWLEAKCPECNEHYYIRQGDSGLWTTCPNWEACKEADPERKTPKVTLGNLKTVTVPTVRYGPRLLEGRSTFQGWVEPFMGEDGITIWATTYQLVKRAQTKELLRVLSKAAAQALAGRLTARHNRPFIWENHHRDITAKHETPKGNDHEVYPEAPAARRLLDAALRELRFENPDTPAWAELVKLRFEVIRGLYGNKPEARKAASKVTEFVKELAKYEAKHGPEKAPVDELTYHAATTDYAAWLGLTDAQRRYVRGTQTYKDPIR